ncbi:MAG: efflux RND transporter periplasmic adaptor subunit [Deltaproteobacteria bacterium]|nr:efflux RND transporter periplasmic adaptor subunit [Deltaproteobacteria bacterium]
MTAKKTVSGILIVLAAVALGVGGTYLWMTKGGLPGLTGIVKGGGPAEVKVGEEKKLYTCPMHPFIISGKPGDCPICGMTLVPVKSSGAPATAAAGPAGEPKKERKILFYRNPMNPTVTSPVPAKDEMGMDYAPVYDDEGGGEGTIRVDPNTVQSMGVRTTTVKIGELKKTIRTVGRVVYDESRITTVNSKVNGWIEKLHVSTTGEEVKKGAPLIDIYSPDLVSAQQEYLIARRHFGQVKDSPFTDVVNGARDLQQSARKRLDYWDIDRAQVEKLEETGEVRKTLTLYSPFHGVVVSKAVFDGAKVMSGMELFRIADLSRVWVQADVYEYELPWVKQGTAATVTLDYIPGRKFHGTVSFVYPYLEGKTRTATARVELANPGALLKPDMYAHVELLPQVKGKTVLVPSEAIIRSGIRNVVFVDKGEGRFQPREVTLGFEGEEGAVQVLSGLAGNEKVVVSGQFLLDSESSLKEALKKFQSAAGDSPKSAPGAPATPTSPAASPGKGTGDGSSMKGMDMGPSTKGVETPAGNGKGR